MELRVLHAVAYQATWYGDWGYEFGRAPFNINKTTWRATLKNVHSLSMNSILTDFNAHTADAVLPEIIDRYQVLAINRYSLKQFALSSVLPAISKIPAVPIPCMPENLGLVQKQAADRNV